MATQNPNSIKTQGANAESLLIAAIPQPMVGRPGKLGADFGR